uniref:Uncharacterized protein n=1 Tax=Meloidogyne floridensis TaxID=298350 RepID=A0A915P8M1_9BILA
MINLKFTLFLLFTFIFILFKTTANEDIFDDYKTFVDQLIGNERRKRENNKSTGESESFGEENDKTNEEILYMAHGLSFNEKDSENFGEDDFNVNFGSENNLNKEEKEILEEDKKDGNEFKERYRGNPYLKDKILNYLIIPDKEIQPPSPSPNLWLQQRLNSEEPLNEEEEELMSILLNKFGRNSKNNLNYFKNDKEEWEEELVLTTTKTLKTNDINLFPQKTLSSSNNIYNTKNIKYKISSPTQTQKHQPPPIGSVPLPTK